MKKQKLQYFQENPSNHGVDYLGITDKIEEKEKQK